MGNIIVRFMWCNIHFFVGINVVYETNLVEDILSKVLYEDSPAFHLSVLFLAGKYI